MKISFIGFGSIAKAIANGLLSEKKYQLFASAPSLPEGINPAGIHTHNDNKKTIHNADVVILAVKPFQMEEVITEIAKALCPNSLLISVASGLTLDWFEKKLATPFALVRAMPNTPVSLKLGATPLIANEHCTSSQHQSAEAIFSHIGLVHWINQEKEIDTFTALSGSGPAFILSFIETLIDTATIMGLDPSLAKQFALQTVKGTLALAEHSELSLKQLREQVTSPKGTTEAGLNVLQPALSQLIHATLLAAKNRAHELGMLYHENQ